MSRCHAHLLENFALRKGHGACYGSNKENNGHCQIKRVKLDINSNEYDVIVHVTSSQAMHTAQHSLDGRPYFAEGILRFV